jgi:hypothetical protein
MNIATVNYSKKELTMLFDKISKRVIPEGKTPDDITGGYVQSLKNGTTVVLFFGYDKNRNKISARFDVSKQEALVWYLTLEAKLEYLRKKDNKKVDLSGVMLDELAKLSASKNESIEWE